MNPKPNHPAQATARWRFSFTPDVVGAPCLRSCEKIGLASN